MPIFTIGEALKGDIGYVSSYSYYMDSVLNYPLYFKLLDVFVSRQTLWNLEWNFQDSARAYNDTSVLGNFIDNHDQPRFLNRRIDVQAYKAALTYVTFALGIPIIYYGSEQVRKFLISKCFSEALSLTQAPAWLYRLGICWRR